MGSERYGGSLCILNLSEPLDFDPVALFIRRRIQEIANFDCTIWTADCGCNTNRVVIGKFLSSPDFLFFNIRVRFSLKFTFDVILSVRSSFEILPLFLLGSMSRNYLLDFFFDNK